MKWVIQSHKFVSKAIEKQGAGGNEPQVNKPWENTENEGWGHGSLLFYFAFYACMSFDFSRIKIIFWNPK